MSKDDTVTLSIGRAVFDTPLGIQLEIAPVEAPVNNFAFDYDRYQCRCQTCDPVEPPDMLVVLAELIFEEFQKAPYISSGYRCAAYNAQIGGSKHSYHTRNKAIDFVVPQVPALYVYTFLNDRFPDQFGLGLYNSHVHLDIRTDRARWDYSNEKTKSS